jgi:hypothetical protein
MKYIFTGGSRGRDGERNGVGDGCAQQSGRGLPQSKTCRRTLSLRDSRELIQVSAASAISCSNFISGLGLHTEMVLC